MPSTENELVRTRWMDLVAALAPPAGIPEYRAGFEQLCASFPVPPDTTITSVTAGSVPALMISNGAAESDPTVLWTHSGGYVFGSAQAYRSFGAMLSRAAGARVLMVDYRLAPEHQHPAALDDATEAYRWLLKEGADPARIVLGGDSAGGGLALATTLALRDAGDPPPAGTVAVSPVADQTLSGDSMTSRAERDPIASPEMLDGLCGLYRGDTPATDPYLSPLLGDLDRIPPLLVLVGTEEVLYDDATRIVDKARAAGSQARLLVGEDQMHIWPLFASILPEGREALDEIGRFVREVTSRAE